MIADRVASVITSRSAPRGAKRLAQDWMRELLARPFTASEAAEKLGISKPTAIKWLRAGLIRRAEATDEQRNLFDAASVLSTREILRQLKMKGTVAKRAKVIAELPERLFWSANREALAHLQTSLSEAESGMLGPASAQDVARGRRLLGQRRERRRRQAARARRRGRL